MDINTLLFITSPLIFVTIWWLAALIVLRNSTAELKWWLTPQNVVKSMTVVLVTTGLIALAVLKIVEGQVVGTVFGSIVGYTLGMQLTQPKE